MKKRLQSVLAMTTACVLTVCNFCLDTSAATKYGATSVTFDEVMEKANNSNLKLKGQYVTEDEINKYAVYEKGAADLITDKEVKSLIKNSPKKSSVRKNQALADVDLLFRTLKSSSATYYYFGANNYSKAEKQIKTWINRQNNVNVATLEKKISTALSFHNDAHCWIAIPNGEREGMVYDYYYPSGSCYFDKDSKGYYRTENGEKWYLQKFSNAEVFMDARLLTNGKLVYSPTYCTVSTKYKKSCSMTLKTTKGKTKKITIKWAQNQPYAKTSLRNPDFSYFSKNGLTYIAIRSFDEDEKQLEAFAKSGLKARESDVIILDIRSNGGGGNSYAYDFFTNLTGERPEINVSGLFRRSKLADALNINPWDVEAEKYYVETTVYDKELLKNDIPIIVLTDDLCGSSGESVINAARSYENVMVVGSNSSGYQLSGNAMEITLPNTGIQAYIAPYFTLTYDGENVESKGRYPDVWTNPKDALSAVFSMLQKYKIYTDVSTIRSIENSAKKVNTYIYGIVEGQWTLGEGDGAGTSEGSMYIYFYNDSGKKIKDYTYKVSESGLKSEKKSDGKLILTSRHEGKTYHITITPKTGKPLTFKFYTD